LNEVTITVSRVLTDREIYFLTVHLRNAHKPQKHPIFLSGYSTSSQNVMTLDDACKNVTIVVGQLTAPF